MRCVIPIRSALSCSLLTGLATVIAVLVGAASAQADFIAAYDTATPTGGRDVAVVNLSTGVQMKLPSGINTPAAELHPSLSPDGRYLAFERLQGTQRGPDQPLVVEKRTLVYDLVKGVDVTPANLMVSPGDPGNATPAFSADGTQIATGRYPDGGFSDGRVLITEARHPPASSGQVAVTSGAPPLLQTGCGFQILCGIGVPKTYDPNVGSGTDPLVSWTEDYLSEGNGISNTPYMTGIVMRRFGPGFAAEGDAFTVTAGPGQVSHPTVGALSLVAYQAGGDVGIFDFGARQNYATVPGVDTALAESLPTWTPDGRYLAFLRRGTDNHQRLVLFDFGQTQQTVNSGGLDLGAIPDPGQFGNLSVVEVIPPPTLFCAAGCQKLSVGLPPRITQGTLVGILVQRIVGTRKLLGRTRLSLVMVGKIPLGFHRRGFRVPTPLRIGGHRLADGRYLLTARTLTARTVIKDLSVSLAVRIRHGRLSR